jgi:HEAT repeat protein
MRLLAHGHERVRLAALETLAVWPVRHLPGVGGLLHWRSRDPQPAIRRAAVRALHLLPEHERRERCRAALEDLDAGVRNLAAAECMAGNVRAIEALAAWLQTGQSSPRSCASVLGHLLKLRPPRTVIEEVARCLAVQAQEYVQARTYLQNGSGNTAGGQTAYQILLMVLVERAQHLVDLALMAIGSVDDPEGLRLIRAGLRSHDRRHIASAREALRYIGNRDVANILDGVLDAIEQDNEPGPTEVDDSASRELLVRLSGYGDPWLRECVERVLDVSRSEAA